ncbi:MAG: hypothetical protein IPG76_00070 [Acidobacteria bacterium]|nr:hypothetical protein [Acidobacteriota bacterium]
MVFVALSYSLGWSQIPTLSNVTPLKTPVPGVQFSARLVGGNFNSITNGQLNSSGLWQVYVKTSAGSSAKSSALTVGVGDFAVSVSPTSRTVVQGQSTTYTVTVQSVSGFSGSVTLNVKNLPGNIVGCTAFSPATVTVPANGSVNSTLTLCTTSQSPLGTFSNLYVEGQGEG